MKHEDVQAFLDARLGISNPRWSMWEDSNALHFFDGRGTPCLVVVLDRRQATQVKALSDAPGIVMVILNISGEHFPVYLYGRKTGQHMWDGITFARRDDEKAVIHHLNSDNIVSFFRKLTK
ncbi:hypothetical protein P3T23_009408 [Paraburkholderia sp. GAS448]|uniref:hypothetical protein n=1 Tax=Paraburkholderia sp. GAS448 TaxID=3035136 RepID=UPI003D199DD1